MHANFKVGRFFNCVAELMLVLYLENLQLSQAFPPKRLEVLKLLCAQAAVTIEKAQMYRSMEEAKQAAEAATAMKSTCTPCPCCIDSSFGEYES
jgi:hypothetical protein